MTERAARLAVPSGYRVIAPLGSGRFGVVYRAVQSADAADQRAPASGADRDHLTLTQRAIPS